VGLGRAGRRALGPRQPGPPAGTLSYSSQTRGVFAELEDQPHLIESVDKVLRRLGGTSRRWRFDRMATVVDRSGKLLASFAAVAKYYGAAIDICPSRRAKRKGAVEKAQDFSAQRWWRTAEVDMPEQAQDSYDRFCVETGDQRPRAERTVAALALEEHLHPVPELPYPAVMELERTVGPSSLVRVRGNRYRLMPGMEGAKVFARWALGDSELKLFSAAGQLLAEHRRAPDGGGQLIQLEEQRLALEDAVLVAFSSREPCRRKENRPPGPIAKAIAAKLTGAAPAEVQVDLNRYAEWAKVAAP
jgi:hypothetical protein